MSPTLSRRHACGSARGGRPSDFELIEACEAGGIGVVGPSSSTVRRLADFALTAASADPGDSKLRRVEVDILADDHGNVWTLGGRDVSVRRSGHALVAEAPCSAISAELAARIRAEAERLARSVDYRGAGVFTFVHDGAELQPRRLSIASPRPITQPPRSGPVPASSDGVFASSAVNGAHRWRTDRRRHRGRGSAARRRS